MTNPTLEKFGYPSSLIKEYDHWCVLLRPAQATLGALVLVCKDNAQAFSDISAGAFSELSAVTRDIENGLNAFRPYQKINYLMLMMVDKDVHFHVIPRYDAAQSFQEIEFADTGWPALPDLGAAVTLETHQMSALLSEIRTQWNGA